jgi:hypothetical protein
LTIGFLNRQDLATFAIGIAQNRFALEILVLFLVRVFPLLVLLVAHDRQRWLRHSSIVLEAVRANDHLCESCIFIDMRMSRLFFILCVFAGKQIGIIWWSHHINRRLFLVKGSLTLVGGIIFDEYRLIK